MKSEIKRITILSLFIAVSLALFSIELLIPPFPFSPSSKIGLANTVTLFMLSNKHFFKTRDCFTVLVSRCILSAVITGRIMSVVFSLTGGIFALLSMIIIRKLFGKSIILMSIIGAVFHNMAQMLVAVCIYGTFSALYYIPALFITGVLSGIITGLCILAIDKVKIIKLME